MHRCTPPSQHRKCDFSPQRGRSEWGGKGVLESQICRDSNLCLDFLTGSMFCCSGHFTKLKCWYLKSWEWDSTITYPSVLTVQTNPTDCTFKFKSVNHVNMMWGSSEEYFSLLYFENISESLLLVSIYLSKECVYFYILCTRFESKRMRSNVSSKKINGGSIILSRLCPHTVYIKLNYLNQSLVLWRKCAGCLFWWHLCIFWHLIHQTIKWENH